MSFANDSPYGLSLRNYNMYKLVVHLLMYDDFENTGICFINVQKNKACNKFLKTIHRLVNIFSLLNI